VECAAIAVEFLGAAFDVQAGGSDLVFPHHEMSASHARVACAADGRVFARVYAHSGMVAYQGQKMSKSLGNLVFVSALRDSGVDPMAIRLAILAHHYRSDWEWTPEVLTEATTRLTRWRTAVSRTGADPAANVPAAEDVLRTVRERLAEDLDAPGALAAIDAWADAVLAAPPRSVPPAEGRLIRDTADALLGVAL
jgi:L-cysteine:1D-myo-inositol 2-amino-2-deoxy-alpha-D-glucopyranoside ligase